VSPFSAIFVPDELAEALSDRAWLDALLEAERALANAGAIAGVVPAPAAAAISEACETGLYEPRALAEQGRVDGNPVLPLVRAIRERVGGEHAEYVHRGATSQDILDSAAMLVTRDACRLIGAELEAVANLCAELADTHRGTVMAARTLLQQAVPTTFGAKAAGWLISLVDARTRLDQIAGSLPAQLGGAAGTLGVYGPHGTELLRLYSAELDLREPVVPWHTLRGPVAELAGAVTWAAGSVAKVATDVILLAQTEVGELSEHQPGGSSTMPNKRNPIAAVLAVACERHARANAAVLFEGLVAEHERAAGAWHAEWTALTRSLAATGGASFALRQSLDHIDVDVARMRANIGEDALAEASRFGIDAAAPEDYLGSANAFVDRALAFYRP
jgi:3-carboxy-cis,cis-muconate cycloisomerase